MEKYLIDPIIRHDSDRMLYSVYIGLQNAEKTLICTVWGNSEEQARNRANALKKLLESKANALKA